LKKIYIKLIIAGILVVSSTVSSIIFFNKTKTMESIINDLRSQVTNYQFKENELNTLITTKETDIASLKNELNTKDAEIKTLKNAITKDTGANQVNSSNPANTKTKETKVISNDERLVNFFASKGVTIPLNNTSWVFATSSTPQSFGAPKDWGNNPVIFVSKYSIKDGINVEDGLRYMYCPALNKGAKIVTENNYFKVTQIYN